MPLRFGASGCGALISIKPGWESIGARGDTRQAELQAKGTRDPQILIDTATECLSAGASIIMIESEGITQNADPWRTDVATRIIKQVGMENVMF
jgi:phosphosulfolactate synthase (CoM biosynthesis protein A)